MSPYTDFLKQVSGDYDIAFMDCNPSFSLYTQIALAACDRIVLPVMTDVNPLLSYLDNTMSNEDIIMSHWDKRKAHVAEIFTRAEMERVLAQDVHNFESPKTKSAGCCPKRCPDKPSVCRVFS